MARKIEVELVGDSRSLERAFARSSRSAKQFNRSMQGTASNLKRGFAGLAAAVGVGFGLNTLVNAAKGAVTASSNLAESLSKSNAVFGESAAGVEQWSETTAKSFGVSQQAAVETASTFGALFGPLGIVGRDAARQSRKLTELGADLASFYNTDVASALDAIRSGLVGEAEPLRRYGVLLSETRVAEEALTETHKKNASQLTVQEKAIARMALIYRDTAVAQGDFARTSDGLAGQQKILAAQIDNLRAKIGDQLRPAIVKVLQATNDWLGEPGNREQIISGTASAVDGLAASYRGLAAAIQAVKDVQGTRDDLKDMLGPFGFLLSGPKETFDLFKRSNENLLEALGMSSGRTPKTPTGLRGAIGETGGTSPLPPGVRGPITQVAASAAKAASTADAAAAAEKAKQRAAERAEAYARRVERLRRDAETRIETKRGWLAFAVERAEATKTIRDDVKAQRAIETWLKARISQEGRTLELVSELWRTRKRIRDLNKSKAKEGDPLAGLMQVSSKKLANMLAAGTGLNLAGRRQLRWNIGAAQIPPVYLHIDGREVGRATTKDNARTSRRTARQTSGFRG